MKKELVSKAILGNASALEELLKKDYEQLYKTAFLYVKNEADALDIVQEAVIKIIRKINKLRQPEFFTTWAVRIVIWTAHDFLRKSKVYPEELSDEISCPEQSLSKDEELDIYEAIQKLPQHLQEITILHYFYGKKLQEISDVFCEPVGTIKYKLFEARKQLKYYLEEDESYETE